MSQIPVKQIAASGATVGQGLVFNGTNWAPGGIEVASTQQDEFYVDAAGSDSNPGTVGSPFATIQHALDVMPKIRRHPAIVHIGAGNFTGALVQGFSFEPVNTTNGAFLQIVGTMVTSTLATGSATGTTTSASTPNAGTTGEHSQVIDATQTWTTNDLTGRMVVIGTNTYPIQSNDAISLTLASTSNVTLGQAYTIQDCATNINGGVATPKYADDSVATSANYGFVVQYIHESLNYVSTVQIENIKISTTTAAHAGSYFSLKNCQLRSTSTTAGGNIIAMGIHAPGFRITRCDILIPSGQTVCNPAGYYRNQCFMSANNTYRGATGAWRVFYSGQVGNFYFSGDYFYNFLYGAINAYFVTVSICQFDTMTSWALSTPSGASPTVSIMADAPGMFHVTGSKFTSCDTVAQMMGGVRGIFAANFGSGNTNGITVSNGSVLQLTSTYAVAATNELVLDGVNMQLTAFRALSPKIWGHRTGSMIHQDQTSGNWAAYLPNLGDVRVAPANKDMAASVTTADNQLATVTAMVNSNYGGGYIAVTVNGQAQKVGDGTKSGVDCYFSGDSGSTARAFSAVVAGDSLYWNGSVAGWQLAATDTIDFSYVQ